MEHSPRETASLTRKHILTNLKDKKKKETRREIIQSMFLDHSETELEPITEGELANPQVFGD